MKKALSVILSVLIIMSCALLFASCGEDDGDSVPKGMKLASDDAVSYEFFVPSTWQTDVRSGATTAYYSITDLSSVSVMVFSMEHSDDDVSTWWKSFLEDFNNVYEDFELISEEESVLDGEAAGRFVFTGALTHKDEKTGETQKEVFKFMQTAAVRRAALSAPEVYVVTYTSSPESYDSHIEEVEKMIGEFRFK